MVADHGVTEEGVSAYPKEVTAQMVYNFIKGKAAINVLAKEEVSRGIDIVATGDMGIGNTTSSSAIASCLTGKSVKDLTGRGTGINDEVFLRKIEIIEKAISINQPNPCDPIDGLSKVGGFEIGGLVGII